LSSTQAANGTPSRVNGTFRPLILVAVAVAVAVVVVVVVVIAVVAVVVVIVVVRVAIWHYARPNKSNLPFLIALGFENFGLPFWYFLAF